MKNKTMIIIIFALWTIFMISGTDGRNCNKNAANMKLNRRKPCDGLAFLAAADKGRVEEIRNLLTKDYSDFLLKYKESAGWRSGFTALIYAAENNNTEIVRILVEAGAKANHISKHSYFPLYFAAKLGDDAMLKALLDSSATVNLQTAKNVTALLTAAAWGHEQAVITLLANKADPNILDVYNSGPLHRAASYGYTNILRKLIEAKADVNAQDTDGKTPLHIVAGRGQASTLQELLKHCPVNTILNNDGEDALDSAKDEKEKLLRKRASPSNERKLQNIERVISILNDYSGC